MKKKLTLSFSIIAIIILFNNCFFNKQKSFNMYRLNFTDSLTINVIKTSIHNKALVINDSVVLYKTSRLIFDSYNPKWLFENTKNKKLLNKGYIYAPDISDIDVPYRLIKYRKSNVFQILKDGDTLNFDFENFDELDW